MAHPGSIFDVSIIYVIMAAILDIFANICVAASRGFRRIWLAIAAYLFVGLAFFMLSIAVRTMDLAVAYAMWGAFGIIGTTLGGWLMFRQVPGLLAWAGIAILIIGILLLH